MPSPSLDTVAGRRRRYQTLLELPAGMPSFSRREHATVIGDASVGAAYTHLRCFRQADAMCDALPAPPRVRITSSQRAQYGTPNAGGAVRSGGFTPATRRNGRHRALLWLLAGWAVPQLAQTFTPSGASPSRGVTACFGSTAERGGSAGCYWYVMMSGGGPSAIMSAGVISGSSLTSLLSMKTLKPAKKAILSIQSVTMTS